MQNAQFGSAQRLHLNLPFDHPAGKGGVPQHPQSHPFRRAPLRQQLPASHHRKPAGNLRQDSFHLPDLNEVPKAPIENFPGRLETAKEERQQTLHTSAGFAEGRVKVRLPPWYPVRLQGGIELFRPLLQTQGQARPNLEEGTQPDLMQQSGSFRLLALGSVGQPDIQVVVRQLCTAPHLSQLTGIARLSDHNLIGQVGQLLSDLFQILAWQGRQRPQEKRSRHVEQRQGMIRGARGFVPRKPQRPQLRATVPIQG